MYFAENSPVQMTQLHIPWIIRLTIMHQYGSASMKSTNAASIIRTAMMSGPRRKGYRWKKKATGKVATRIPPE